MQNHSTRLKKDEPFDTGIPELNDLMVIYWAQLIAMADAEQAGLPEPDFMIPPLPFYVKWSH
jgi:hypothetical protein